MADIIFDVDGTLMDITHRRHFVAQRPKDFDSFRSHTEFDTRKEDIFAIADALQAQGHRILISTGRNKSQRDITIQQIRDGGIDFEQIYMRSDSDYTPDDELKSRFLDRMIEDGYFPTMAFDDRQRVVDMFRSRGLTVFQVAEGNF
jgi:hydroxymethylpyrimidine pyrophosphatase-like HAD family hydrolase